MHGSMVEAQRILPRSNPVGFITYGLGLINLLAYLEVSFLRVTCIRHWEEDS
jgi:hypothetical protein